MGIETEHKIFMVDGHRYVDAVPIEDICAVWRHRLKTQPGFRLIMPQDPKETV
jgi:hypothetical protein